MPPDIIKKTVVFAGYRCNNNCRFCMEADKRDLPVRGTAVIKGELKSARERGSDYIEIIGGEAAMRSDITSIISYAKDLGFSTIMMATNGRMFSYPELTKRLIDAGLNSLVFSIHGADAETHDYLTRSPGSFDQLIVGMENVKNAAIISGARISLGSNTCIVKDNYRQLPAISELIASSGVGNSEFIFVDCNEGGAKNSFDELVPKISDAAPYMRECLDIGNRNKADHWDVRYVPLCYFPDHLNRISELHEAKTFHTEHIAQDFVNTDAQSGRKNVGRRKSRRCSECILDPWCEGIWRTYISRYGDDELIPITELTVGQKEMLDGL
ncbi:MAG: radical SAM protein [Candidatus Colwellbacteria bacterium]|nr:radical SAM protein [Candidatus Colwellbacteria bacterium]